jgi:chromosomal replication initiation ATPase DnaA
MERTKNMWAHYNYPPTDTQIQYNKIMLDYTTFDEIVSDVCRQTRVQESELVEKTKNNHITQARYLIYYLAKVAGYKPKDTIRMMSSMGHEVSHSTIIYGIKEIEKLIEDDKGLDKYVSKFLARLEY